MPAKITGATFDALRDAVEAQDTLARRERYIDGDFPRAELVKDLDTRYRWDLYWAAGQFLPSGEFTTAHIDTALRAIVRPLYLT